MSAPFALIGSALDPDPGGERMALRRAAARLAGGAAGSAPRDPYDVLAPYVQRLGPVGLAGKIAVDGRMTPLPASGEAEDADREALALFLHREGCRSHADAIAAKVARLQPTIPVMVGIDHSASGGAIEALSRRIGAPSLGVVVLDSHSDVVPSALRRGLIEYARENPQGLSLAAEEVDSGLPAPAYDCGSFLNRLIECGALLPRNLVILGCSDVPDARLATIGDARVKAVCDHFRKLAALGATFVPRERLIDDPETVATQALGHLAGKSIYISVDLDVGANAALTGVRFLDREGLEEWTLAAVVEAVLAFVADRATLAGLDLMEFDFYRAGAVTTASRDRTYDIALGILARAVARLGPNPGQLQNGRKTCISGQ